jgi:hypothetical protein
MDTRLIFRDSRMMRWGDGGLYIERINGFAFVLRGRDLGKSGSHKSEQSGKRVVRHP